MPSEIINGREWIRRRLEFLESELINADDRTRPVIEAEIAQLRHEKPLRALTPGTGFLSLRRLFRRRQR